LGGKCQTLNETLCEISHSYFCADNLVDNYFGTRKGGLEGSFVHTSSFA